MTKTPSQSSSVHLLTLTILLLTLPFHGNSQTNQETTILIQLKQFWSNPPSLSHWTPSSDPCTWPEITCSDDNSVTSLEVGEKNITTTIPPFICDLNNLNHINISFNIIHGNFPSVLYNCTKLEYLDLSGNYFTGTIPDDIGRMSTRLEYLNLGVNNFSGDVPSSIGSLTSLTSLQLGQNSFNGSFPSEIGNLSNLEDLVLSFNAFAPQSIPSSFTRLKKLRNLWMTEANLIGEIPDTIGNMSALEFVDLSVNGLSGSIPDGIFLLENLTTLFLFKNRLFGTIPRRIEAVKLQVLDLSNNTLNGTIPDDFGKLTNLTGLALFFNQLSGEMPVSLGRLPGLINLAVFNNELSGELPPDFGRYSPLERFQVSENRFVGELPRYLCANQALIGVIVFENQLTGELPESLAGCNSLQVVRVYDNQLSGEVPDGLWKSTNLTTLMLSNNLFTGQLPDEVSSQLQLVELMNNQFSGRIPVGISSWKKLTVLRGSNNLFSGELPQQITDLSSLSTLLLDGNQLSGNFPYIVSWTSLTTLNLSRNQLQGDIPASLAFLPLVYLDLSRNQFSGRIPPQIGRLKLPVLNLSSNKLSGRVPGEYENAAFDSSFLNNPGLCSNIPSLGLGSCRAERRNSSKLSSRFIAAVSSIAAVAFLVAFVYTIYVCRKYKKNRKNVLDSTWKLTSFQRLNFTESNILSSLTDINLIGSGGSGRVYQVPLNHSGEYVAVKRIWDNVKIDQKLEKEFDAEVEILGSVRHSSIVKLLCCISSGNAKLLVYEYMQNRSLDRWLHGKKKQSSVSGSVHPVVLDWPKRLHIAIGAAHGLCYMHHDCSPPIIHRDVKCSNILLDSEFNAKIADFGLARLLIKNGEPNTMSVVAGSFGYMAPEYTHTRRVNEKIDVYSFGVVLLELVTGKEAHYGDETSSLAQWAWRQIQEGEPIVDAIDEDIKESHFMEEITSVLKLGIMCTSKFPTNRPAMKEVLRILQRCSQTLPTTPNTKRNEKDIAPLLQDSKPHTTLESDSDSFFTSTI